MDIMNNAIELGKAIAQSSEMTEYKKYEAEIESDDKAKKLLAEYKNFQIELVKATRDNKEKEEIESLKNKLLAVQQEINEYDTTRNYLTSKSAFDSLMKKVNDVIIFSITGEEPCSPSKCGSCSGCK